MEGFMLLLGHLIGDYVVQNDWQAANKTNAMPDGSRPCTHWNDGIGAGGVTPGTPEDRDAWDAVWWKWMTGHLACTVHCLLYTLAVWACSFWWMPWWGTVACFIVHWPTDRFRLAGRWMRNVSGQKAFATGPLSPWSVIVVDNTWHLLTLGVIAALAGRIHP